MPKIDPQQLLKTLGVLLSPAGGIKSSEEVDRLVKLMRKFSRKLVSKCIYVQILMATPPDLLAKFLVEGGWALLNTWFDDAIKAHNWPLVKEMLLLFLACPITSSLLKENALDNQAPKLINQLRQESSIQADIRSLAADIYKSWVSIVSAASSSVQAESSSLHENQYADQEGNPVSLLQSLADEVSQSLKNETSTPDIETSILSSRKVPTVLKPKSGIIDGSIKINKKNLPTSHPLKSSSSSSAKSEKSSSSSELRKRKDSSDKRDKDQIGRAHV